MSTLLLRLAAPLQSWGVDSKFNTRGTAREPTKSGVIGLLAAALGRRRLENLDDLNELSFGVRIDQPGVLVQDYHIARRDKERNPKEPTYESKRYYLADAVFLVGLEGEEGFLQKLTTALQYPVFPLYLGRRSCPPAGQLVLGLREKPLLQAIREEPWQASKWYQQRLKKMMDQVKLTIVCDAQPNEQGAFLRRDLPVSFNQRYRQYGFRMLIDNAYTVPIPQYVVELPTDHDAMAAWGG